MPETAHMCRAYAVTGSLDTRALRTAWRAATTGHRVPAGVPAGPDRGTFGFMDLGRVADPGPWETAERLRADPAFLSFPAACGPAARLAVARPAGGGLLVMLAVNREFEAGHRVAALVDELGAAYAAATGRTADTAAAGFDWCAELSAPLGALCSQEGVGPFDVLLAAYCRLVGWHGGEHSPTVGVRGPDGDLLTVRADLTGRPSFRELTGRTAELVREAGTARQRPAAAEADRAAGYDALFSVEEPGEPVLRLTGARVHPLRSGGGVPKADLALTVHGSTSLLAGRLEYRTVPFDAPAAPGLLGQLRTLLRAALDDPDAPADTLPLETPEQHRAAVRQADRTAAGPWSGKPVHERVRAVSRAAPDALALAGNGETLTYGELCEEALRITRALRALGVGEGAPVALRLSNGPRRAAALLGTFGAGAHAVCLGTGLSGERGRAVLSGVRPHCLLVSEETADPALTTWFRGELGGHVLDLDDLPAPGTGDRAAVPGAGGADPAERWAYVAYTSGSTGFPKGIPQTHRTFAQFVEWFTGEFGIGPGARVAQWSAPGYDAGLVELFAALTTGATLCPVPERTRAHPEKLTDWLRAERITHLQTVPSFARQLLAAFRGGPHRPPPLEHLLLAGEALSGELAEGLREALPATRLVNLYGATETILATWHEVDGPVRGAVPVGRPIPGRQVLVLDEHDRPCATGVTGRIAVCGPHVTPGYVAADSSGDAFRPVADVHGYGIAEGPCHRTGDLGRRRWDGALEFKGRGDSRIKVFGTRLELTDIEAALAAEESVTDCAVAARTGADGLVTRLVAYVVPHRSPDGEPTASPSTWRRALRRWFGKALPPVSFVTLTGLPRNSGGKVDRRALADLASSPH